jgi:RNA polymerase sigma-70 factor (ECF subfamily)
MSDDDAHLVKAWVKGDRAAFDELYGRYKGSLFRYLVFLLRDTAAAEDVFHRTFMRFFENAARLAAAPFLNFKSWIFKVAVNLCRDDAKSGHNRKRAEGSDPDSLPFEHIPLLEAKLDKERISKEIDRAITGLPDKYKRAVGLYYYAELSGRDIGRIEDIPEGTVKSRLNTAFTLLAGKLKGKI